MIAALIALGVVAVVFVAEGWTVVGLMFAAAAADRPDDTVELEERAAA